MVGSSGSARDGHELLPEEAQTPLEKALASYIKSYFDWDLVWEELTACYGRPPDELGSPEEFLDGDLSKAVAALAGDAVACDVRRLVTLLMPCSLSSSDFRRSYHATAFCYHAADMINEICSYVRLMQHGKSVEELLYLDPDAYLEGSSRALALEIDKGNQRIIGTIEDMILKDNGAALLSYSVIEAIIISGNGRLMELLGQLLVSARLQEGLRQAILESADVGRLETFIYLFRLCIDEDLFRYSSAVRAFLLWTGLDRKGLSQSRLRQLVVLAYECLVDRDSRARCMASSNPLELYLGLWADGCEDATGADRAVEELLCDECTHRRLVGWYLVWRREDELPHHADRYRHALACAHLDERDDEVLAWLVLNLACTYQAIEARIRSTTPVLCEVEPLPNRALPPSRGERLAQFLGLKELAIHIGSRTCRFRSLPFLSIESDLSSEPVLNCLISLAAHDLDDKMVSELYAMRNMFSADQRRAIYINLLDAEHSAAHRLCLYDALRDRSSTTREYALARLDRCRTRAEDVTRVCGALGSRHAGFRKRALSYLARQEVSLRQQAVECLLPGKSLQLQAAIELMLNDEALGSANKEHIARLRTQDLPAQTRVLLDQLAGEDVGAATSGQGPSAEDGYGLFDRGVVEKVQDALSRGSALVPRAMPADAMSQDMPADARERARLRVRRKERLSKAELMALLMSDDEVFEVLDRVRAVFEAHGDFEYETVRDDGTPVWVRFGDATFYSLPLRAPERGDGVAPANDAVPRDGAAKASGAQDAIALQHRIPLYDEFRRALGDCLVDSVKMLMLCYRCLIERTEAWEWAPEYRRTPWFVRIEGQLAPKLRERAQARYGTLFWQLRDVVRLLLDVSVLARDAPAAQGLYDAAFVLYFSMRDAIGPSRLWCPYLVKVEGKKESAYDEFLPFAILARHGMVGFYRDVLNRLSSPGAGQPYDSQPGVTGRSEHDERFARWFMAEYAFESGSGFRVDSLSLEQYAWAVDLGLIPQDCLCQWLLYPHADRSGCMSVLSGLSKTARGRELSARHPWIVPLADRIIHRMVDVEALRGEMPTGTSRSCYGITRVEGVEHFCRLLVALGKERFHQGYEFACELTKRETLSFLLRHCYPAAGDTPQTLRSLVRGANVRDKRLVEAAMYAPQWAGVIEGALGWEGLRKGVWLFHAHVSEAFSAEKETEVAVYSPIPPRRFNDGAFDVGWFKDVYATLGAERFKVLYECATYISSGSLTHRRSQLYADAILGKLDRDETERQIEEERHKEKLRAYALILLDEADGDADLLHRYEFICAFEREGRRFGATRRESEKRACAAALENLAQTAGLSDVNRLIWRMEAAKLREIRPLMEGRVIAGFSVCLAIDGDGVARVLVRKKDRTLKHVPATLRKDAYVALLKQRTRELKEQLVRSRATLEAAMVDRLTFEGGELLDILKHPVIAPMLGRLVWACGQGVRGFASLEAGRLAFCDEEGQLSYAEPDETFRIAHPHDLLAGGVWASYMRMTCEQRIVQPFKQVFREYYPITGDERRERIVSRRYSGHQVRATRAVALLKGRGWTVDHEEGLQKVCYDEGVIVRMYAMADWFSPADVEAPTLETIRFFGRASGEPIELESVSPVLFSEVMRDIDLVVSIASASGVDVGASPSTIEMRRSIAGELVSLMGLGNVELVGSYAKVRGTLGRYSVHLGSGTVHVEGRGVAVIVPVHSQHRGRLFLPFADDDPKTAEVMSKIVLLAKDNAIKDPTILAQIRKGDVGQVDLDS